MQTDGSVWARFRAYRHPADDDEEPTPQASGFKLQNLNSNRTTCPLPPRSYEHQSRHPRLRAHAQEFAFPSVRTPDSEPSQRDLTRTCAA